MAPTLEHRFSFRLELSKSATLALGATKGGTHRFISPILRGFLRGSGIDAEVVAGSSECPLLDTSADLAYIDGRVQFRDANTGDACYMLVQGVIQLDEASQLAFTFDENAKSTIAGSHAWFTTPTFEVSNPRDKWMEQSWFVSQGHWHIPGDGPQWAEHDVYMMVKG